jgi:hypothetical protein
MPCVPSLGSSAHGYEKFWREGADMLLSPLAVVALSESLNENSVPRDAAPQYKRSAEGKLLRICRGGSDCWEETESKKSRCWEEMESRNQGVGRRWNHEIKERPGNIARVIPCGTPPNRRSWLVASDRRVERRPSPSKRPAAPRRLTEHSNARRCHLSQRSCNQRVRRGRGLVVVTGIDSKTASFTSLSSQAAQTLCPLPARLRLRHNSRGFFPGATLQGCPASALAAAGGRRRWTLGARRSASRKIGG